MRDKSKVTVDDVIDILQPSPEGKDACKRDVIDAIDTIKGEMPQMLPERQLRNIAAKFTAVSHAITSLPPEWRDRGSDKFLSEAARVGRAFTAMANRLKRTSYGQGGRIGRNRSVDYRRKVLAAYESFLLMLRWGERAPTLAERDYYNLTAALFQIAVDKLPGDVETACEQVFKDLKKHGYDPAKLVQYRQFTVRTGLSV